MPALRFLPPLILVLSAIAPAQDRLATHLYSYEAGSGRATVDRFVEPDELEAIVEAGRGEGWTSQVFFVLDGETYLVSYRADTGAGDVDHLVVEDGVVRFRSAYRKRSWGEGWSQVLVFYADEVPYILYYDEDEGSAAVDEVGLEFSQIVLSTVHSADDWGAGWTRMTIAEVDDASYLICYAAADGSASFDRIVAGEDGIEFEAAGSAEWDRGITWLAAASIEGTPCLLSCDARRGLLTIDRIEVGSDDEPTFETLGSDRSLGKGRTVLEVFSIRRRSYLLAYRGRDGTATIARIALDGDEASLESLTDEDWGEGWTRFLGFRIDE